MSIYKSRRVLKDEINLLHQELAKKENELASARSLAGLTSDRVGVLATDRQEIADAFWLQRQRSYFAFKLQAGLILSFLTVMSIIGTFVAIRMYGVNTPFYIGIVLTAISIATLVWLTHSIKEPSDRVALASGEVLTVSAQAIAQYRQDMATMTKS